MECSVVELEGRNFTVDEPGVVPIDEVMPLLPPLVIRIVQLTKQRMPQAARRRI